MPERIRVGIVGASPQSWAAAAHLPALAHLDDFTVTAVATTRQDSARAAAGMFGIGHAFASADELAAHPGKTVPGWDLDPNPAHDHQRAGAAAGATREDQIPHGSVGVEWVSAP